LNGNSETCTEERPRAGIWHIGLRGYRDFSGATLTVSYDKEDPDAHPDTDPAPELHPALEPAHLPYPAPNPLGQCVTATNDTHVSQGRAYQCGAFNWLTCAVGSGDDLGLAVWFFSMTSSVQETAPNYWELVPRCP
jgi:hypothetical protein